MNLGLDNRVALVTGASEGLGKSIALGLAKEGARVAISGRRKDVLEKAAEEITGETGTPVLPFAGDMTRKREAASFIKHVAGEWNRIDILVNNVGQATRGYFESLSQDAWQRTFEINLLGAVHCTGQVLPFMKERKWGRIINISALSGKEPTEELIASNVVKSGLVAFSKTLSRELAGQNILVNCISPGIIDSPQNDRYFSKDERKAAVDKIALGRFGQPEEFADVVVFLCSERAGYVTGVNLLVDGGASRGM